MIAGGVETGGSERDGSGDGQRVGGALAGNPEEAEAGFEHRDAVGLLVTQFAGIADLGDAVRLAGEHSDDRELVDASHGQRPGDRDPVQLRAAHLDVRNRLDPARGIAAVQAHRRAHRLEHVEDARSSGVHANARAAHAPARPRSRERQEERRRAEITGDSQPEGFELAGVDCDLRAVGLNRDAAHGQEPLGVVPGHRRFDDRGRPIRGEPGEEDRGFHLGARNG